MKPMNKNIALMMSAFPYPMNPARYVPNNGEMMAARYEIVCATETNKEVEEVGMVFINSSNKTRSTPA